MSETTKKLVITKRVLKTISIALNVVPMLVFFFIGFKEVETTKKVVLSFTAVMALVLGLIMIISKLKIKKSIFWILFFVMYFCLQDMYGLIIAMGSCTIIDELIIEPLLKHYKDKVSNNKDIDKRLKELNIEV